LWVPGLCCVIHICGCRRSAIGTHKGCRYGGWGRAKGVGGTELIFPEVTAHLTCRPLNDPSASNRKSLRLKGYDYHRDGWYFVTVCVLGRTHLLGEIDEVGMHLSAAGKMVQEIWDQIPARFPQVELDERVVMPNHLHGILVLTNGHGVIERALGDIIGAFKSISTDAYIPGVRQQGWQRFDGRLWQRNDYEHVIRDGQSLRRIQEYIRGNPQGWGDDPENVRTQDPEPGRRAPTRGAPTGTVEIGDEAADGTGDMPLTSTS
jgi:REP element-mobilizing transposase RayT